MSGQHQAHGAQGAHGSEELDEPRTPLWLPLLGLGLLLSVVLYFIASRPDAKPASELRTVSAPAAPAASAEAAAEE
jgi:hypothetical protein